MSNAQDDDKIERADDEVINSSIDLPDSTEDTEKMKSETVILDLPEVKDIPGQEHVKVLPLGEMADTTISSDDEEGAGIVGFDEINDDDASDLITNTSVNVSREEKDLLEEAGPEESDDEGLKQAELDKVDEDGEPLNEGNTESTGSSADLDVPGAEMDDADEDIGEEDEENNDYSVGDSN